MDRTTRRTIVNVIATVFVSIALGVAGYELLDNSNGVPSAPGPIQQNIEPNIIQPSPSSNTIQA